MNDPIALLRADVATVPRGAMFVRLREIADACGVPAKTLYNVCNTPNRTLRYDSAVALATYYDSRANHA